VKCWNWAKGKYHVAEENPFRGLATRFKSQEKKPPQPFSALKVRAILDGFRASAYYSPYTDFVAFLFGAGCRIGEAVGLRWENVAADFSIVYSRVQKALSDWRESGHEIAPVFATMARRLADNSKIRP
jgi:integrase